MRHMVCGNQVKKTYRVLAMLKILRRAGACRIAILNPGGCSERSVQRDMECLVVAGFAERIGKGLYKHRGLGA